MPVVMGQVSQLGNSELSARFLFSSISGFDSSPLALYPVEGGGGALHVLWCSGGP